MSCEDDAKCCCCFPIDCGVKVFAVLSVLGTVNTFINVFKLLSVAPMFAAIVGVAGIFFTIASIIYLKYLLADI